MAFNGCYTSFTLNKIIMQIYKFKDSVDGSYAFILAKNRLMATRKLNELTSIPFVFVDEKSVDELDKSFVILNNILPF